MTPGPYTCCLRAEKIGGTKPDLNFPRLPVVARNHLADASRPDEVSVKAAEYDTYGCTGSNERGHG